VADVIIQSKHFLSDKLSISLSRSSGDDAAGMLHGAVNLAQGFPDFPAAAEIKLAAQQAVAGDVNQYAITWGAKNLRNAIARQMGYGRGFAVDPEKEIYCLLRIDRGHDFNFVGGLQCRRRSRDLRTIFMRTMGRTRF